MAREPGRIQSQLLGIPMAVRCIPRKEAGEQQVNRTRHSATRRGAFLLVTTVWVALVSVPCTMASAFSVEMAAGTASGSSAGQAVTSHDDCLTPPPADPASTSDDCRTSLPVAKSDGARPPDSGAGFMVPWPLSAVSRSFPGSVYPGRDIGSPPGSQPAIYLATLRLRI